MSEVYIRSQNKEKLYRLGGNYACVEYGEYEDIKKKRGGAEADKKRHVICISDGCLEEIGEYATKERCLEVLDEIQKACVISKVATWGTEVKNKAVEGMKNVITGITDVFKDIGSTFAGFGKNMVEGIWNGISGATRWIKDKISDWVGDVTDFLKDLFGIASPSKLMRDEIGVYLAQGIGVGFSNEIGGVKKMIEDSVPQEFDVDAKVNVGNEFKYDNDDKKPKPRGGGSAAGGVVVNQYIYANTTDYAKQQKEAARQFRMIARTV